MAAGDAGTTGGGGHALVVIDAPEPDYRVESGFWHWRCTVEVLGQRVHESRASRSLKSALRERARWVRRMERSARKGVRQRAAAASGPRRCGMSTSEQPNTGGEALCEMAEHGLCDQPAENVSTIPMAGHGPKYLLCHDHLVEFGWAIEESEAFSG